MSVVARMRDGRESSTHGERGVRGLWHPRGKPTTRGSLLQRVLHARGIEHPDAFLSPSLMDLHNPSLIPDLDDAAQRIFDGVRRGERIVIYGDYDVDGTTACAILFHTLRAIEPSADVQTYLPHRIDEGYGLHADAITRLADEGADLIISVDCGITAVEEARLARTLGVDLIITDHHNPPAREEDLPEALHVVHPRRPDSAYPFGELCGAGVAYKLAWRLCTISCGSSRITPDLRRLLVDLLGLCALGTIADVVPLVDENRAIVRFGLPRIRSSPIEGMRALIAASHLDGDAISEEDVGFRLAPRLNACGRLGHANATLELLTTAGGERARQIARDLSRLNDERRRIEGKILEEALARAKELAMDAPDSRCVLLAGTWHPGVVGIVCSRLVESLCRPSILLCEDRDLLRGSGRSVPGFDLHAALTRCADLLEHFGGHYHAAGLCLRHDRLDALRDRLGAICNDELGSREPIPVIAYDADARVEELTLRAFEDLQRLAPFGSANPRPHLRVRGARLAREPRSFGRNGEHALLHLVAGTRELRIVAWRWMQHLPELCRTDTLDLVIAPAISTYGAPHAEPTLVDLRPV